MGLKYLACFCKAQSVVFRENCFRIEFPKGNLGLEISEFHGERYKGTLDGAKYIATDQVFPFFGRINDSCFGNSTFAPVTKVFLAYVDFVNRIFRRF